MRNSRVYLTVLLLFAAAAALTAPARAALAPTPYEQAVIDYEDSAHRQLDAYRAKIDAALKDDNLKQRYVLAKMKLDECSALLAKLKAADERHFDPAKATFEHALAQLIARVSRAEAP